MRFTIASIAAVALLISSLGLASAKEIPVGLCTCFTPKYDASCCSAAGGFMLKNNNVCFTPDVKDSIKKYESCCTGSGGHNKCKSGGRDSKHWPPSGTYGCKA